MDLDDEEREKKEIERRIKIAQEIQNQSTEVIKTIIKEENNENHENLNVGKIEFSLNLNKPILKSENIFETIQKENTSTKENNEELKKIISTNNINETNNNHQNNKNDNKRKLTAVEEIIQQEIKKKEKFSRKDYWLTENIIVKVMNKKLADGKYYKKKGIFLIK